MKLPAAPAGDVSGPRPVLLGDIIIEPLPLVRLLLLPPAGPAAAAAPRLLLDPGPPRVAPCWEGSPSSWLKYFHSSTCKKQQQQQQQHRESGSRAD
jgi:hypothetical protein